jgi:periplasmic divalent cation tolerance protein
VSGCCQVTTTLPDQETAERLADRMVEERLAACAQVLGPVASTYRWQGKVEKAAEWYCHLKTTIERMPALQTRIQELHPYEVPEIIVVQIAGGNPEYLAWIRHALQEGPTCG